MSKYSYKLVYNFGSPGENPSMKSHPLTYCLSDGLSIGFNHGSHADTYKNNGRNCQLFLSEYCANNWDNFCELSSKNNSKQYVNHENNYLLKEQTAGDALIYNTASKKYLVDMINGEKKWEPFDPTVANSPMISYWVNDHSKGHKKIPVYSVNPETIDDDPVMNKIIKKPSIAMDILINIYNTMKRNDTLKKLKGTKLGIFYNEYSYFRNKGGV